MRTARRTLKSLADDVVVLGRVHRSRSLELQSETFNKGVQNTENAHLIEGRGVLSKQGGQLRLLLAAFNGIQGRHFVTAANCTLRAHKYGFRELQSQIEPYGTLALRQAHGNHARRYDRCPTGAAKQGLLANQRTQTAWDAKHARRERDGQILCGVKTVVHACPQEAHTVFAQRNRECRLSTFSQTRPRDCSVMSAKKHIETPAERLSPVNQAKNAQIVYMT